MIVSILLVGMGQLMVSDYSIVKVENDYANSLAVAEAGINYELRKITTNASIADQKKTGSTPGTSYTTAAGTFSVYVTQRNSDGTETTPWTTGNNLWIYSTGGVNNLTRTVKVAATPYGGSSTSNYAVFGVATSVINGTPTTIYGDVGTNAQFTFNGHPTVTGNVIFNGSGSGWQSPPNGTYRVTYNANPVTWPSVETIATSVFGASGLSYVASHNDNNLASPALSGGNYVLIGNGNQTFFGKAGGANYYLTSLTCNGNSKIVFDNTNGPITLWVGPSGTSSTFVFAGGTSAIKMTSDPTKPVRIYIATSNDVQLNGNDELDAGIYNINNAKSGRVLFNGNPNVYGMVVSNTFNFNGNPNINADGRYFSPTTAVSYYGCVQPWMEIGGVN